MGLMASRLPRWASSTSLCSSSSSTAVAGSEATDTYLTPSLCAGLHFIRGNGGAMRTAAIVADFHELQAVGGRRDPCLRAVLVGKDLDDLARQARSGTHFDQGSHQDAD